MRLRLHARALLALSTALLAGCLGGADGEAPASAEEGARGPTALDVVDMVDNRFLPATLTVDVGTTVTWKNLDRVGHTVTPEDPRAWGTEGSGDAPSAWMQEGATWSHTFDAPGRYAYYCAPHAHRDASGRMAGMTGVVVVR